MNKSEILVELGKYWWSFAYLAMCLFDYDFDRFSQLQTL